MARRFATYYHTTHAPQKSNEAELHKLAGALLDYETLSFTEIRQVPRTDFCRFLCHIWGNLCCCTLLVPSSSTGASSYGGMAEHCILLSASRPGQLAAGRIRPSEHHLPATPPAGAGRHLWQAAANGGGHHQRWRQPGRGAAACRRHLAAAGRGARRRERLSTTCS